jgi:hypothetical protein
MIVSKSLKFIFAAIPKTGTHAIRRALREHMSPEDWEQVGLFVQRASPIAALSRIGHGHITLAQLRPHMAPEDFASFIKFAFVRNPFDRFVSYSSFITREVGDFDRDPQKVMRYFLANPPWNHILFRPQHEFVTDEAGNLLTDFIGRVETMQQSYDEIAARIGIPTAMLEVVNSSRRNDYREYYDQPLIDGVAGLYARDLELFGYQF